MPAKKAQPKPSAPAAEGPAKPEPKRAGGYVDRGDGRGWVLEEVK